MIRLSHGQQFVFPRPKRCHNQTICNCKTCNLGGAGSLWRWYTKVSIWMNRKRSRRKIIIITRTAKTTKTKWYPSFIPRSYTAGEIDYWPHPLRCYHIPRPYAFLHVNCRDWFDSSFHKMGSISNVQDTSFVFLGPSVTIRFLPWKKNPLLLRRK